MTDLPPTPPVMPLAARLLNVFVVPGRVFDAIKGAPPKALNWVLPLLLSCLAGVVYSFVILGMQPAKPAAADAETVRQKQIQAAKLTEEQARAADAQLAWMTTPAMRRVGAVFTAVFGTVGNFLVGALVIWVVAEFAFKAPLPFPAVLQICGLAAMISGLGELAKAGLVHATGTLGVTLGPSLFVANFDPSRRLHDFLSKVDLMSFWYVFVLAVGLAKFTGVPVSRATRWLFTISVVIIMLSLARRGGR